MSSNLSRDVQKALQGRIQAQLKLNGNNVRSIHGKILFVAICVDQRTHSHFSRPNRKDCIFFFGAQVLWFQNLTVRLCRNVSNATRRDHNG
jgi:hypothetical protein